MSLRNQSVNDDDDEFELLETVKKDGVGNRADAKKVDNQHYDEAVDVSDEGTEEETVSQSLEDSNMSDLASPIHKRQTKPVKLSQSVTESQDEEAAAAKHGQISTNKSFPQPDGGRGSEDEESEEDGGAGANQGGQGQKQKVKLYNPNDWLHMKVPQDIKELFDYITRYKPQDIELDTKLKPFIPDYIPAVGDIDAFLKVPPPDSRFDGLGLVELDEPASSQSDPTVLELQLNIINKSSLAKPMTVRSIEHADKNPKKITSWVTNIQEVHRKKPPPSVVYARPMPDIESLMQIWPQELEQTLKNIPLPNSRLDLTVAQYARVVCAMLDIPVYDKVTDSLHVLFTLYSEFKNNAHFNH